MAGETILIVDDEVEIVELIGLYLRKEGYRVVSSHSGAEALSLLETHQPDLIILDILLPEIDGIEVCRRIRLTHHTPVIFLSCKNEDMDVILGFSIGGDDYMTKPFSPGQLVARVKAHLRRNQLAQLKEETPQLSFPGLEIDLLSRSVRLNGTFVPISSKEFDLLIHLAKATGRVIPLEQLYKMTWGADSNGDTRTLLVHISNLRKKIEPNPSEPRYIVTVRGIGYKFNA